MADSCVNGELGEHPALHWRPRFHFTAPRGWLNDPNGLVRVDGAWHLHYQYEWPRCWGHAVSRDLFRWEHWPVALRPDAHGDCWSGGTVHDRDNTSGLFKKPGGGLVSIYTSQDTVQGQRISLASSTDGGRTWENVPGNPILRRAQRDCRDPKVFWHADRARWVMVLTEGMHLTFFVSSDLREWRETGRFTPRRELGADGFECPDLFLLPVENRPGASKWVLTVSYLSGDNFAEGGGFGVCAQRYYVGEYDGATFRAETGVDPLLELGSGPDEYATIVWPRETGGVQRTLAIGWMNHWGYAKQIPTGGWQGCLTLPRELTLVETAAGHWSLRQAPARELWAQPKAVRKISWPRLTATDGRMELGCFRCGAVCSSFRLNPGTVVTLGFFGSGANCTMVGYDYAKEMIFFDRCQSGSPEFDPNFSLRREVKLALGAERRLELIIVIDGSTVEVFANGGEIYLSGLTFPPKKAKRVSLEVGAGAMEIENLETWEFLAAKTEKEQAGR